MKTLLNLLLVVTAGFSVAGSFPDIRYPAPGDFARLLKAKFPLSKASCLDGASLDRPEVQAIIGVNDAQTGEPIAREPGPAFIRWYVPCVSEVLRNYDYSSVAKYFLSTELATVLHKTYERQEKKTQGAKFVSRPALGTQNYAGMLKWSILNLDEKQAVVGDLIGALIGPGVLEPGRELAMKNELIAGYESSVNFDLRIEEAAQRIVFGIVLREEFLLSPQ